MCKKGCGRAGDSAMIRRQLRSPDLDILERRSRPVLRGLLIVAREGCRRSYAVVKTA